ncbi:MAG: VCBS repeat-containing protein [Actinobacteria bacterium]|nr:VCBS repeat-containing protein [Actinomycetota bacterium]
MRPIRSTYRKARARTGFMAALCIVVIAQLGGTLYPGAPSARADAPVLQGIYDAVSSFYQTGITASDLDGDGREELLVGNQNGCLYCFTPEARVVWMYGTGSPIQGSPACYDVDGDGKQEVWVGDMDGRMWGFDSSGKPLVKWGWPKQTYTMGGLSGIHSSPAVGDINGDGAVEIVVGTWGQRVYAWTYDGQALPGWPFNNEDTVWSSPALADIDWDGVKEVVIGADSTGGPNWPYPPGGLLYVLEEDASVLPGFPRVTPEVTWSSPAVVDIDADGRYEIIVGTGHYYTAIGNLTTESHRVYAYNHDGSPVPGWPAAVAGSTFSSPSLGDVDGDGTGEIVVGTIPVNGYGADGITVLEPDGNVARQIGGLGGPTMGSAALGDVTGDGVADIIAGSGQRFYAWDGSGNQLWMMEMGNFVVSSPAVGDFDGDGSIEVAVVTGDAPGGSFPGGKLYVYDCGRPAPAAGAAGHALPWRMFRRAPHHRATVLTGGEPNPVRRYAKRWYMAEGSTAGGMETWILVQNPGDRPAKVSLTYMTGAGCVAGPEVTLPPRSRRSFNAAETVPDQWEVATRVASDRQVVAERAVYGNSRTWAHASVGTTSARKTWYLAEGSTGPGMETWVLVQNPNTAPSTVTLSFMTDGGLMAGPSVLLPACSRKSFNLAQFVPCYWGVSTHVQADRPVVAERAVYGNGRTWATGSGGAGLPATTWHLAEGSTANGIETYLLVQNPKHPDAHVQVDYLTPDGPVAGPGFTVKAGARRTIYAADTVNGAPGLAASVTSDTPVVLERAMYGNGRAWGTASVAMAVPKKTWYLAEGSTAGGMETWITVQNPNDRKVKVTVSYLTANGAVAGPPLTLAARSRATLFVADTVPNEWEVSTVVAASGPVVAERAMYGNGRAWGHESLGFAP